MKYINQLWKYKHLLISAYKNDWVGSSGRLAVYWKGKSAFERIKMQIKIILHPIKHPICVANECSIQDKFMKDVLSGFSQGKPKKPIDCEVKDHILK